MPTTIVDAAPFVLVKPKLTIGTAATTLVEYECAANEIDASPDQDSNDTETFCGVFTSYKPAKWTVTVTALTSFGTTGLWNALRPLVNTVQPFQIIPDITKAIGPDNVAMQGNAYIPEFPFLQAAVGETSDFDLVLAVQGDPAFLATPAATGATAGTPGTWTPGGSTPPASVANLQAGVPNAVTASPATAWTTGQYVQTGTAGGAGQAHWTGTAWASGPA